jgi:RNA polymerase-binding transcription factor DksA
LQRLSERIDLHQGRARVSLVKSVRSGKENAMKSTAERQAQLEARTAYLQRRIAGIGAELDSHEAKDWEEMATEREGDEVLEDLGQSAQTELRMIDAAMTRIAEGEYGYCMKCGDRIAEDRLDLLPATPFCANCAP